MEQAGRDGVEPEDVDNQMAVIAGLTLKAAKGDAKAAKVLFDLLGEQGAAAPAVCRTWTTIRSPRR